MRVPVFVLANRQPTRGALNGGGKNRAITPGGTIMAKLEIPCEQCDGKRREMEMKGYRVLTCESKSGDPDTCVLLYERASPDAPPPKRVLAHAPKGGKRFKAKKVKAKAKRP